jgi:hypothetical protein
MKRSNSVGLVVMGGAVFAATFAGGTTYMAWQKPVRAAQPQLAVQQPAVAQLPDAQAQPAALAPQPAAQPQAAAAQPQAAAQNCTPRPDGTCQQPAQRGFTYYLLPQFGSSSSTSSAPAPKPQQAAFSSGSRSAALTNNARPNNSPVSSSGVQRSGFGSTASSSTYRVSAGG